MDLSYQVDLLDLLDKLQESKGKTIVMILHDLNLSCRYGDYLVAIQQGKVYATGTPEQVMTEEMVRDVFNLECCIVLDPLADTPMCIPMGRKTRKKRIQEEQLPNKIQKLTINDKTMDNEHIN